MRTKVRQTIEDHRMLSPGERVLVAVSGGVDSIVLLHLLHELQGELGISLAVGHLDHRIRGEEARADAEFVAKEAEKLKLPLVLEESDVPRYAEERGLSLEEAAREVRYQFLEEAAEKVGAAKIALGHHRDDLVETLLLNLIRGTGLSGLRGIAPVRGKFIRPLIGCSREEIIAFARERGLEYRQDRTNLEQRFLRNRVRMELLPLLEGYRPGVAARLARTARMLGEAADYLEELARGRLAKLVLAQREGELVLDRGKFLREEPFLQSLILREAVRSLRGSLRDLGFEHLQKMRELSARKEGEAEFHLPGEICFLRRGERLILGKGRAKPRRAEPPAYAFELPLRLGENLFNEIGWRFTLEEVEPARVRALEFDRDPLKAVINRDRIDGPLSVRNWRPGDRFRPLGMEGTKKLQDLFIDEKVPREERSRIPLVCDRQGIIWVVGLRLSDDYKVREETERALRITAR
ncbi:TPA: tRNA lysidine(34) synthetase TilS, partial [Candidatus Bipolaricaulota bacterium]|nr:tRNA lysidine(34) synthetase TilS [Candidatus Bipolaricaulota bacterium]